MSLNEQIRESWQRFGGMTCRVMVGLLLGVLLLMVCYTWMRINMIFQFQRELAALTSQVADMQKIYSSHEAETASRLDYIEGVLFGEVLSKVKQPLPPVPPKLEAWMQNRIGGQEKRLTQLEYSRMRVEGELENLKRQMGQAK